VETLVSREMLAKAMASNSRWANRLGWSFHMGVIATLVASATADPGSPELAEAVAEWQKANGLDVDGIIGPITWPAVMVLHGPAVSLPFGPGIDIPWTCEEGPCRKLSQRTS
jgi:murein L,D-transpeptidase YcbB/YkuD